ncbi:PucR family transcriptional regulator [Leucobacter sp. USHLN153]|uniref:PucR family transcriptional regulator n=1 Tax=Leucobacter sp. USHLN153 TaxID=3081268 RepID=UPI0030186A76
MVALSTLLALPHLGLRLVQSGAGDPEITWVSNTELLDLGGYLEGGEIVLTTGLALGADDARWRDFVAGLNRARVAAIGFGVGVNHERIPQPLVQAASMYRVALFEVPLPVPFIAVSKAVAELLRADELGAARGALQAQQRLWEGARGDQQPAEVLASLAQATGKQLALLGPDGEALASTAGFAQAQSQAGASPERQGQAQVQARASERPPQPPIEIIELEASGRYRLAIAGGPPLGPEGRSIVAAGALVLGLTLHGDRADERRERERWERATTAALSGEPLPPVLAVLAPSLAVPARIRVLAVQGAAEDLAAWRRAPRVGLDRLVAPTVGASPAPGVERAWQIVPDADAALRAAIGHAAAHGLDVVVGRASALENAELSRRSAAARLHALSPTAPLYEEPRVPATVWADRDTPIIEALLALDAPEVPGGAGRASARSAAAGGASALTASVLGPLSLARAPGAAAQVVSSTEAAAPQRSSGDRDPDLSAADRGMLRDTLRAVFAADGQRGPAAAALGIHRNTLRDRITRIERLTGRSLGDPDDRAELWIALRVEDTASPR